MGCRCNKAQTNGAGRPNVALDCVCWSVCSLNAALMYFFSSFFLIWTLFFFVKLNLALFPHGENEKWWERTDWVRLNPRVSDWITSRPICLLRWRLPPSLTAALCGRCGPERLAGHLGTSSVWVIIPASWCLPHSRHLTLLWVDISQICRCQFNDGSAVRVWTVWMTLFA